MVGQDHEVLVAQVRLQPRFLVMIQRHAFIAVVGQAGEDEQRLLRQGQQALLLRRHGDARRGVNVQHAADIVAHLVHGAVNGVTGRVDVERAVHQLVARQVDLDQARRRDFVEHQAIGVDQEIFRTRYLGRDMGEDQIIPAIEGDQPVAGGEVDACTPFGLGNQILHGREFQRSIHGGHLDILVGRWCPQSSQARRWR